MSKQFWIIIAVIVVGLIGFFVITGDKSETGNGSVAGATNHVEGNTASKIKLVEYGDYQCPYCQTYYATVKQVVEEYKDQISFQFVNFPLTNIHQNAFAASRAAEAAGKQDKYWEMHDLLYQNNDPNGASGWVASNAPTTFFDQFAQQIGLNMEQFKTDYASQAVNNAINADLTKGNRLKVEATPSFYLNGKATTIANTPDAFKKVLDEAIAKADGTTPTTSTSTDTTTPAAQ